MNTSIILDSMTNVDFRGIKLPMIVIYNSPKDFKGKYVARVWEASSSTPTNCIVIRDSVEELREDTMRAGFRTLLPRAAGDDPVIVESWV